jgi:hypothetical protein
MNFYKKKSISSSTTTSSSDVSIINYKGQLLEILQKYYLNNFDNNIHFNFVSLQYLKLFKSTLTLKDFSDISIVGEFCLNKALSEQSVALKALETEGLVEFFSKTNSNNSKLNKISSLSSYLLDNELTSKESKLDLFPPLHLTSGLPATLNRGEYSSNNNSYNTSKVDNILDFDSNILDYDSNILDVDNIFEYDNICIETSRENITASKSTLTHCNPLKREEMPDYTLLSPSNLTASSSVSNEVSSSLSSLTSASTSIEESSSYYNQSVMNPKINYKIKLFTFLSAYYKDNFDKKTHFNFKNVKISTNLTSKLDQLIRPKFQCSVMINDFDNIPFKGDICDSIVDAEQSVSYIICKNISNVFNVDILK